MKSEHDKALCEKYPKIFIDRHASMRTTAMCWGFDCGDGWYDLIDEICGKIQEICDREGFQVKAVQVKEKYGTLRFYTDRGNDEIFDLLGEASRRSGTICEICGAPGKVRGEYWFYCACDEHSKEDKDEQGT